MEIAEKYHFTSNTTNELERLLVEAKAIVEGNKKLQTNIENTLHKGVISGDLQVSLVHQLQNLPLTIAKCERKVMIIKSVMNDRLDEIINKPISIDKSVIVKGNNTGQIATGDNVEMNQSSIVNNAIAKQSPNPINIKPIPIWLKFIGWLIVTGMLGAGVYISYLEYIKP